MPEQEPLITETVPINGPLPPQTGAKQRAGSKATQQDVSASATKEYVSGGSYIWVAQYIRSLPWYVDDITKDFGDDLYERMLLDPQVASCIHLLKMAILASGGQFLPRITDEDDRRYARAKEIQEFCQRNLEGLRTPFVTKTLYNMLDALALGNKVAEQIYERKAVGPDAGKLCLKAVKVKPRRSVAFVVDVYNNVIGLLGMIPGQGAPLLAQSVLGNPDHLPNLLPRKKFAVLSYRPKDEDPRGTSILRPVYNPWWLKQQTWGQYLKYLTQFGTPSIIGTTAPNAQPAQVLDENGDPATDPTTGLPLEIDPETQMRDALIQFQGGTAAAFPNGSTVTILQAQGNGEAFVNAFKTFNVEIAKAILLVTLATEQAEKQARAAAETHQDSLELLINLLKAWLCEMVQGDILTPLVEYNFPAEDWDLVPCYSLAVAEQHDFAALATAIAALMKCGYLVPSQLRETDAMLNLPERGEDEESAGAPDPATGNGEDPEPAGADPDGDND